MNEEQKIETAIAEIENSGLYGNQVHQKTLEMALQALREQQERENGCNGCDYDGHQHMYYSPCTDCIRRNGLEDCYAEAQEDEKEDKN